VFAGPQRGTSVMSPLSWRLGFKVECLGKYVDQGDILLQSCLHGRREETSEDCRRCGHRLCPIHTVWWVASPVMWMLGEVTTPHVVLRRFIA
jgi:hypothetical protein